MAFLVIFPYIKLLGITNCILDDLSTIVPTTPKFLLVSYYTNGHITIPINTTSCKIFILSIVICFIPSNYFTLLSSNLMGSFLSNMIPLALPLYFTSSSPYNGINLNVFPSFLIRYLFFLPSCIDSLSHLHGLPKSKLKHLIGNISRKTMSLYSPI